MSASAAFIILVEGCARDFRDLRCGEDKFEAFPSNCGLHDDTFSSVEICYENIAEIDLKFFLLEYDFLSLILYIARKNLTVAFSGNVFAIKLC
ncbi:hypothetical protein ANTQUA_LOCUS6740 [Anthophora quadrimaculata]